MKKKYENVISEQLGVYPVVINSALVSAQNRVRLYWTNIRTREEYDLFGKRVFTAIPQPEDREIYIRDILEDNVPESYHYSEERKSKLLDHSKRQKEKGNNFIFHPRWTKREKQHFTGGRTLGYSPWPRCVAVRGRFNPETGRNEQAAELREDGKSNTLTTVQKDNLILQLPHGYNSGAVFREKAPTVTSSRYEANNLVLTREVVQINPDTESNGRQPYQQNRVYSVDGISPALCSAHAGQAPTILTSDEVLRCFTPTECARLQTIPEWYKWECSNTQQYKMLGNGWTVEVIKHIFSFLPEDMKEKEENKL